MSKIINFTDDLYWITRSHSAHSAVVTGLERDGAHRGNTDLLKVLELEHVWDSMDSWYFDQVGIEGLTIMREHIDHLLAKGAAPYFDKYTDEDEETGMEELKRLYKMIEIRIHELMDIPASFGGRTLKP